jgi:hypothetical protein
MLSGELDFFNGFVRIPSEDFFINNAIIQYYIKYMGACFVEPQKNKAKDKEQAAYKRMSI